MDSTLVRFILAGLFLASAIVIYILFKENLIFYTKYAVKRISFF